MSNINVNNINGAYPIAGQSNPSQGFRDNFTSIKNNLTVAYNEITDLQNKAILTSPLSNGTFNNNMAGSVLGNVQLLGWSQSLYNLGNVSGSVSLNFATGNFQELTTTGAVTLGFVNWPNSTGINAVGYATMRIWINVTSIFHTVTFPSTVNLGSSDIAGFNSTTGTLTFDQSGTYVFDISSTNSGSSYFISDVSRNRATIRDPNLYFNPATSYAPTLYVGYGQNGASQSTIYSIIANDQGQNAISTFGSYNSSMLGNLTLGNISNATLDTGKLPGYTITSARGNLATLTYTPVQSGDYLGYHNSVIYTGLQGTANTFQQVASMAFYATGGNVTYGIGGNIAFFTSNGGATSSANALVQALSINNDQSVEVLGILKTDSGIAEKGTYVVTMATSGAATFTANSAISTLIIDSLNSATVATANVILPASPTDRFRFRISSLPIVNTANIYAPNGATIKYTSSGIFGSGNTQVQFTYQAANSTWYRS
jgi:hypothetical protein